MFCFLFTCLALSAPEKESDASQAQLKELQKLLDRRSLRKMVKHDLEAHLREIQLKPSDVQRADVEALEKEVRETQKQLLELRKLADPKKSRRKK